MKDEMRWLIVKAVLIAVMLGLLLWRRFDQASVLIAANIVVVVTVMTFLRRRYPERYKKDEMTRKVGALSASWSWMITLFLVTFLFWFDYLDIMPLTASQVIGVIFVTMIATVLIFRALILRRGDL